MRVFVCVCAFVHVCVLVYVHAYVCCMHVCERLFMDIMVMFSSLLSQPLAVILIYGPDGCYVSMFHKVSHWLSLTNTTDETSVTVARPTYHRDLGHFTQTGHG